MVIRIARIRRIVKIVRMIRNKLGLNWAKLSSNWTWDLLSLRFAPFMNRLKLAIKLIYWN